MTRRLVPGWCLLVALLALFVRPHALQAQEIHDSVKVHESLRPELSVAVGAAFPQGDFTRNVNTGLDAYLRFSFPVQTRNGLSLLLVGGGADFSSEDHGALLDSTGAMTSATQKLDYKSAYAHLGLQWTGSWQSYALRPRVGLSAGAHWVETQSSIRLSGAVIDSLTQTSKVTRPGVRLQLGSDWVLRNNVAITFEFKLDHVFKVAEYEVSDGVNPAEVLEKSVSYISFLGGIIFPL